MQPICFLLIASPLFQDDPTVLARPLPLPSQEIVYDDPASRTPTGPVDPYQLSNSLEIEDPTALILQRPSISKADLEAVTADLQSSLSIRELLTEVGFDIDEAGTHWARGRDYRAAFDADSFSMFPVFGPASPKEFPVRFALDRATLGGEPLDIASFGVTRSAGAMTIQRVAFDEIYHLDLDQVEQTFVFDSLPAAGDLALRLEVDTDLVAHESDGMLYFLHPDFGHVSYGAAFVLDAAGKREPIERTWTGSSIELTVPAAFLAEATFPVTIDPVTTAFNSGFGVDDDQSPDIAFA